MRYSPRLWITLVLRSSFAAFLVGCVCQAGWSAVTGADTVTRLQRRSDAARVFQARFDALEERLPLPKDIVDAQWHEKLDDLQQQAERIPGDARGGWLTDKGAWYAKQFAQLRLRSQRRYRARLCVEGEKFFWGEPKQIWCYNGTEMFDLTNPEANGRGEAAPIPWLHIMHGFNPIQAQGVPFYGLLHPLLPMFSLADLGKARSFGPTEWLRVGPTKRLGGATPGLVRLDRACDVQELRVFAGQPRADEANIIERWRFLAWNIHGTIEFPSRITADWFILPPLGAKHRERTVRSRHLQLSLRALTPRPAPDSLFSIWVPPRYTQVQDERFPQGRIYHYGDPGVASNLEDFDREASREEAVGLVKIIAWLAAFGAFRMIRRRLQRRAV